MTSPTTFFILLTSCLLAVANVHNLGSNHAAIHRRGRLVRVKNSTDETLPTRGVGSGKPPGTQYITGPCANDGECASGCCGFNTGLCAGPIVAKERDGGCGFNGGSSPSPPNPAVPSPVETNPGFPNTAISSAPVPSQTFVPTTGNQYRKTADYAGQGFFDNFDFEDFPDPTHGRVNYVNKNTAIQQKLAVAPSADSFILRTDFTTVLDPNGPGRNSVRIRSKKTFREHVAVFDVKHMPQGCGTWPAIWEVGPNWPSGGELDILEGVNDEGTNAATLHTAPGCIVSSAREAMRGVREGENCDATINGNRGCPVLFPQPESYGPAFNQAGGGWYAIERSSSHIKVWFWSRNDGSVPQQVQFGADAANPDDWGKPTALFPADNCNMDRHFNDHSIIINLTLCGDWAGNTYGQSGCPGTCIDRVNFQPGSFEQAFFDLGSVRVYEK